VNSHVELTVADTGEGIGADGLPPRLSSAFRQGRLLADAEPPHGGRGLGLSIVKHLVGGACTAGAVAREQTRGRGQGTTMVVALPIMAAAPTWARGARKRPHPTAPVHAAVAPAGTESRCSPGVLGPRRGTTSPTPPSSLRVILEMPGARVLTPTSAAEALASGSAGRAARRGREATSGARTRNGFALPHEDPRRSGPSRAARCRRSALTGVSPVTRIARGAPAAGFHTHLAKPVEAIELVARRSPSAVGPRTGKETAGAEQPARAIGADAARREIFPRRGGARAGAPAGPARSRADRAVDLRPGGFGRRRIAMPRLWIARSRSSRSGNTACSGGNSDGAALLKVEEGAGEG
jgi:hypothetical protein